MSYLDEYRTAYTPNSCPACGTETREEHGHTRCTNPTCGLIAETCCEGGAL